MLIKTKIYLAIFFSIGLMIFGSMFLFYARKQENSASESRLQANASIKCVFDLSVLTNEYVTSQKEEVKEQWYNNYQNCVEIFNNIETQNVEGTNIQKRILYNQNDLKNNFDILVGTTNVDGRKMLADNLVANSQNVVSDAFQLFNVLNADIYKLRLKIYYAGFFVIIFLLVIILVLIPIFYNSIIHPTAHLNLGVKEIAAGNYGYKIAIKGNNEISDLSRMFNNMSEAVKNSRLELMQKTKTVEEKQKELEDQKDAVLNVLEDVEEEKERSELLVNELEKFRLAVKEASDHIVITDIDGKIIDANKAAEKITGYALAQMLGKTPALWGKQMSPEFYKKMWNTIKKEKEPFQGEVINVRSNGQKYTAEVHIVPILGNKRKILFFVGIERDITREKEIDRAKTEFVSLASHQLRTPLTAISWYTEMLQNKGVENLSEDQRKYLERIYQSNRRMISLVNALLSVSRIEAGTFSVEPSMVDLVRLSDSVFSELTPLAMEKKIKLHKKYGRGTSKKIKVDEQLVRIIVQNLLSNSIKYTPSGGSVKFTMEKNKNNIKITVTDNGYGIPRNQQEYIFTKLFRADNIKVKDTDGTGLGLYLVKSILDSVGGKIWFTSTENKGSTFYVTLPIVGMKPKAGTKRLEFGEKIGK